ncbi:orotidine-5'-phosphate decarboxylase [Desulforudis sp. 1088]|uniref:orotidine-5'-phosphate decarboxylase n=2 Tax=Candidatus Desulforudis TaxID=471826 RepID=UPI0034931576
MQAKDRIFVALDFDDEGEAVALARSLAGSVGGFKIGMRLFYSAGREVVGKIAGLGCPVFLDLKLHDIPQTVGQAVRAVVRLGASIINVHAAGGGDMLRAAAAAAAEESALSGIPCPKVIAVTVLTSLGDQHLAELGIAGSAADVVARWARLVHRAGLDGVVASAREARTIRETFGPGFLIITPGIRLPGEGAADDQVRVASPGAAVAQGADYLVVGRPITKADDPPAAVRSIVEDIESAVGRTS